MNQDKYVFAQLVEFLNNNKFRKLVDKYDGNHAFYMMKEASEKRTTNIFDIPGKKYALILRPFPYVLQRFLGLSFVERKVALKLMSFMTLKHKYQHSIL